LPNTISRKILQQKNLKWYSLVVAAAIAAILIF